MSDATFRHSDTGPGPPVRTPRCGRRRGRGRGQADRRQQGQIGEVQLNATFLVEVTREGRYPHQRRTGVAC